MSTNAAAASAQPAGQGAPAPDASASQDGAEQHRPAAEPGSDTPANNAANMSDEDLKAALSKARGQSSQPQKENQDQTTEQLPKPGKKETLPPEAQQDVQKLQKMVADQNRHIGKTNQQLGELRSRNASLESEIQALKAQLNPKPPTAGTTEPENLEEFFKNPQESVVKLVDAELAKREEDSKKKIEEEKTNSKECFEEVSKIVPEGVQMEQVMPFVFAALLEDGAPQDFVEEFARNPFKHKPTAVKNLVRRALLAMENHQLKNGTPNKKPAPPAAKRPGGSSPSLTASSGTSSPAGRPALVTRERLANMTDEELKAYKAQLANKPGG